MICTDTCGKGGPDLRLLASQLSKMRKPRVANSPRLANGLMTKALHKEDCPDHSVKKHYCFFYALIPWPLEHTTVTKPLPCVCKLPQFVRSLREWGPRRRGTKSKRRSLGPYSGGLGSFKWPTHLGPPSLKDCIDSRGDQLGAQKTT